MELPTGATAVDLLMQCIPMLAIDVSPAELIKHLRHHFQRFFNLGRIAEIVNAAVAKLNSWLWLSLW